MNSQKQENLLSLAMTSTEEERQKSQILEVGIENDTGRWEVIVKYHGNLERIANDEIQVETLIAGYAIVTLPAFLLGALADLEEVEYIEKPKSLVYGVYEAKQNACITSVAVPVGELSGKGVLLAVIDSGIDYFLPDFQNEEGSRIFYLWDQGQSGEGRKPPEGFRVGAEYTRAQIDAALQTKDRTQALAIVPQQDMTGHGTGVAAVAASSNPDPLLQGVAPQADLIIVKLKASEESGFPSTTEIMRAVTYVVRKSIELNRPLVINLSLGNTYGAHDGSSLLERFLDNTSEIGQSVICVGAGNEGSSGGHFSGNAKEVELIEFAIAQREVTTNLQLWKSYEDSYAVVLTAPNGEEFRIEETESPVSPGRREFRFDQTKILVYAGVPVPYSTKQEIFFVFLPMQEYINSGIWSIRLEQRRIVDGEFQMYLPPALQRNSGTRFFRQNPELTMTIPATSSRLISVGAYNDTIDAYADFSGRGRQDGFTYLAAEGKKPDLTAPGVGLLAARAGGGTESYTGTSFSTPMVSGAAALLMEWGIVKKNDRYLYGEKLKAYLRKGAKPIRGEKSYPNSKVGWGALCVEESIPERSFEGGE